MSHKSDALRAAIKWLELQTGFVTEWESYSSEFKKEYQSIINMLREMYEFETSKN